MTLPKLLGIGAQKAGTSWLHENLAESDHFWTPPFKEQHFFDHLFIPRNRRWTTAHVKRGVAAALARASGSGVAGDELLSYLESLRSGPLLDEAWYRRVFENAPEDSVPVDITPEYGSLPSAGIDYVCELLPGVRAIYILRDPIERAVSQLRMAVGRRRMEPTPEDWDRLVREPDIRDRSRYWRGVTQWERKLGPERMLFIPFGLVRADPIGTLRAVENFAGVPPAAYPRAARKVHSGRRIDVPPAVTDYLSELLDPQYRFLSKRFGGDFMAAMQAGPDTKPVPDAFEVIKQHNPSLRNAVRARPLLPLSAPSGALREGRGPPDSPRPASGYSSA